MIVDVIACQPGDDLLVVLEKECSTMQEEVHQALVKKRDQIDKKATQASQMEGKSKLVKRNASILGDTRSDSVCVCVCVCVRVRVCVCVCVCV